MSQQRHIIKQQILELRVDSQIQAIELQNRLSALYRSKVVPLIDACCNQFSNPDAILRIDRLDIDLGEIDIQNLEHEFVEKVMTQLGQQLSEKLGSPASP
ncbi:MAG: contractile injection system tape measure protein, partial [Leptolyngbyaceae cyanobacterium MO_188.B28]|nr:contractile injection system tape measure protein [Leptolyngbyaceae cyanobacterium MO_188.B28]